MINHVQPIGSVDSNEHVLFSLFDAGGTTMSCARTVLGTMVITSYVIMMALSLSNGRQMPSDSLFIM